jgi:hypothetical protein
MTDYELNKAIADKLGLEAHGYQQGSKDTAIITLTVSDKILTVDYCNNWNDLMPLVVEHDIEWSTCGVGERYHAMVKKMADIAYTRSDNLQRALAECLLEVLKQKEVAKQT